MLVTNRLRFEPLQRIDSGPGGQGRSGNAGSRPFPFPVPMGVALIAADAVALSGALGLSLLAARWWEAAAWRADQEEHFLWVTLAAAALVLLGFAGLDHYTRRPFRTNEARDVLAAGLLALLGSVFLSYMVPLDTGRAPLLAMWAMAVPGVLLARFLLRAGLRRAGLWRRQAIVIGDGSTGTDVLRFLSKRIGADYHMTNLLHPDGLGPMQPGCWSGLMRRHRADLVVLAMDDPPRPLTEWLVRDRVPFAIVPRVDGLPVQGSRQAGLMSHDGVLRAYRDNLRQPAARGAKMVLDVVGSALLLLALAPLLAVIAAAIKLDGGSVVYAHKRIGAGGLPFPCLKFRSMVRDSDAVLAAVLNSDPAAAAEWHATQKLRDDPRVTAIGRILRKTSLDELPQLFNVLRLEMSLVGPRPIVTAEIARYGEDIHYYYAARPGLTGLWQVSGRSDTGYTERVQLDAWYVKNWSLPNDLRILFRTVPAVLARRGAV